MNLEELKNFIKDNKIKYAKLSEVSGVSIGVIKQILAKSSTINPRIDTFNALEKAAFEITGLNLSNEPHSKNSNVITLYGRGSGIKTAELTDKQYQAVLAVMESFAENPDDPFKK